MNWLFAKSGEKNFANTNLQRIIRICCATALCALFLAVSDAAADDGGGPSTPPQHDAVTNDGGGPSHAQRGGIYFGIGLMDSGNFSKDMKNFLSSSGGSVSGSGNWLILDVAYAQHLFAGLYIVPEVRWANCSINTTMQGFESSPNQSGVGFFEYGGGLRYYIYDGNMVALFIQAGLDGVSGYSDVNGFPMKSDGLAEEFKIGAEIPWKHVRIGTELGYSYIPMEKPIDPNYAQTYNTPTNALGGNYGGIFFQVTVSGWW